MLALDIAPVAPVIALPAHNFSNGELVDVLDDQEQYMRNYLCDLGVSVETVAVLSPEFLRGLSIYMMGAGLTRGDIFLRINGEIERLIQAAEQEGLSSDPEIDAPGNSLPPCVGISEVDSDTTGIGGPVSYPLIFDPSDQDRVVWVSFDGLSDPDKVTIFDSAGNQVGSSGYTGSDCTHDFGQVDGYTWTECSNVGFNTVVLYGNYDPEDSTTFSVTPSAGWGGAAGIRVPVRAGITGLTLVVTPSDGPYSTTWSIQADCPQGVQSTVAGPEAICAGETVSVQLNDGAGLANNREIVDDETGEIVFTSSDSSAVWTFATTDMTKGPHTYTIFGSFKVGDEHRSSEEISYTLNVVNQPEGLAIVETPTGEPCPDERVFTLDGIDNENTTVTRTGPAGEQVVGTSYTADPTDSGSLTATITTDLGCERTVSTTVPGCVAEEEDERVNKNVFGPTAFSPNGDGFNDTFLPLGGENIERINYFRIFDRRGELVYEQDNIAPNDLSKGWDGTFKGDPMDPAVFVWMGEVTFKDGTTQVFRGEVNLLR